MENLTEEEIMASPKYMQIITNLLRERQFSEDFLIKTNGHYDSWDCLKWQKNLSPYFCFRYLYDNKNDSADNWTDYYDVIRYLERQEKKYTDKEIEEAFSKAYEDRQNL